MQHFLSGRQRRDVPIGHLFVEYRYWIDRQKPFASVRDELATLARQREDFRRIVAPRRDDPLHPVSRFLDAFDVRTAYPLLLAMLDTGPADAEVAAIGRVLESYLLRRAVLGLTTKNYNRLFLQMTAALQREGFTAKAFAAELSKLSSPSAEWPDDDAFRQAWMTNHIYFLLNNPKVVLVLKRLSDAYFDNKSEEVVVEGQLTVEHLLPQSWLENWPLPDGSRGLSAAELSESAADDPRVVATARRNRLLHTIGNLTILSNGLNSLVSNGPWDKKRPELLKRSLLPINQSSLYGADSWDEEAITARGKELFEKALVLWPRSNLA